MDGEEAKWYRQHGASLGVGMWAVGTIMAEMSTKRPLFPGDSEIDEIFKIFRVMGTPNEENWPGVTSLQDWNTSFPVWPSLQLSKFTPTLEPEGRDVMEQLMAMDPRRRLSALEAMKHPYFADIAGQAMNM